ncbi:MAG TPA: hypothetical protein ENO20_08780 [Bacteroides sp.]|nr:hypothetical protein [Bacteroides sp.]
MRPLLPALLLAISVSLAAQEKRIYHSSGGEIIFSGADVNYNLRSVNTNTRFTIFLLSQHHVNLDLTNHIGLFTGFGLRNIGLIQEDQYQHIGFLNVDRAHPDFNKNVKIKRRSYSLGFPIALKLGSFKDHFFLYGGYEYEWMFHYKQKLFIDGEKHKFREWTSDRVNSWIPSLFAGIQFPAGLNLKFKYYLEDFLNSGFSGTDFGEAVDYSQYDSSRIWYISLSFVVNRKLVNKWMEKNDEKSALSL